MKNKTIKILAPIVFSGILLLHAGCSKMNDIQQEFVGDGEITYIAKADSIYAKGGINKVEIKWTLLSDPKIAGYKIFWNNRKDSLERPITRGSGVDYIKVLLTDMEEGTYNFEIYTFDKIGNSSIKTTVVGKVYGEKYEATLLPRTYRKLTRIGNDLQVEWMPAEAEYIGGELAYLDNSGNPVKMQIAPQATTTLLTSFPVASSFELTSAFKPTEDAIDIFYKTNTTTIPVVEVNWKPYVSVFGHLGSLLALDGSGTLVCYVNDGNGGFKNESPKLIDYPWYIFDTVVSYKGNLVGREIGSGFLYRYTVNAQGVRTPPHVRLGPAGWQIYDLLFTSDNFLFVRMPNGQMERYPISGEGNMDGGVILNGNYSQYDKIEVSGTNLMCREPNGKLWRVPVSSAGVAGAAVQIDEGWNEYVMMTHIDLDLLGKKSNGELWRYPVDANGNIGTPEKVTVVFESL